MVQRAHVDEALAIVEQFDPNAFVTIEDPLVLRGGSVVSREWRVPGMISLRKKRPL